MDVKTETPHESAKFSPVEENKTYTPQEETTSADPHLDQSQLDSSDLVTSETNPGALTPTAVESPIETKTVQHRKRFSMYRKQKEKKWWVIIRLVKVGTISVDGQLQNTQNS